MEPGFVDVRSLAQLLQPPHEQSSDEDDDLPPAGLARLGPDSVGPKAKSSSDTRVIGNAGAPSDAGGGGGGGGGDSGGDARVAERTAEDAGAIWSPAEAPAAPDDEDGADPRARPDYDMCFRQAVTPEDVFLQMGGRTPASASCEDLVVRVRLPGERLCDVALSVTRSRVDVRARAFRLALPLPHAVAPDASRAHWDAGAGLLTLTLRLVREFDYVNF